MNGYICCSIKSNCWNLEDSYGEICVGCGCCSRNKKERYESRIAVLERHLYEQENFSNWADGYPELLEIQKKNVAINIDYFKRRLKYYRKKLNKLIGEVSE